MNLETNYQTKIDIRLKFINQKRHQLWSKLDEKFNCTRANRIKINIQLDSLAKEEQKLLKKIC